MNVAGFFLLPVYENTNNFYENINKRKKHIHKL